MSSLRSWPSEFRLPAAVTRSILYRVTAWLIVLLAAGAALTLLPVKWIAIGLLAIVGTALTAIRPQTALYLIPFAVPFGSLASANLGGISVGITDALIVLALATWLANKIAFRQPIAWPRLALPALLLTGTSALSLLHAESLPLAAKELAKWLEFLAAMVVVANVASHSDRQSHTLVACLLLAGIAQAGLGVYQFLTRSGPEFFAFGRFMRAYGTFEQPNPFGGYLGLSAPLALALALCSRKRTIPAWLKWLALASFLVTGAGIAMSGSRGAWLGAAMALGLITVAHGRQGQIILLIALLLIALVGSVGGAAFVSDQIIERMAGILPLVGGLRTSGDVQSVEVTDANYANLERLAFWQAAADMWADRPWLGVGIGNYQAAYPGYSLPKWRMSLGHAHNYYLNIAAETGLLGLIAYLALWIAVAWRLAKTAFRARSTYARALALGALGVVTHASIHNVVDNLWVHHMYIHVAIILGLVEARSGLKQTLVQTNPYRQEETS